MFEMFRSVIKISPTILLAILAGLTSVLISTQLSAQTAAANTNPKAVIHTSMGDISIELFADKSPLSVENFIRYVNSGYYDGTIFHRVISHFMIQGGGMTEDLKEKPTSQPINNESMNGLSNKRGTLAMARTNNPHSATSQFFINVQDNGNLDHPRDPNSSSWGYAVFGKVTEGMEVVDSIRFVETKTVPPFSDVPVVPVVIQSVEIVSQQGGS